MALDAVEFDQRRVFADSREMLVQLPLLLNRKQDIGLDADDENTLQLQSFECRFEGSTVLGKVKQV